MPTNPNYTRKLLNEGISVLSSVKSHPVCGAIAVTSQFMTNIFLPLENEANQVTKRCRTKTLFCFQQIFPFWCSLTVNYGCATALNQILSKVPNRVRD